MGSILKNGRPRPCLYFFENIIVEVNKEFIDLAGFTRQELLNKSIIEIGNMLKINSQIRLDHIEDKHAAYIFTKELSPREVNISVSYSRNANKKRYTFVEKPNSRLEDKLIFVQQTFIDNISAAGIYSVPDLILLKSNEKYLKFIDPPFNKERNGLGQPITEIVNGFAGSQVEVVWKGVLETQKTSYIKEFEFDKFIKGTAYFDCFKTPIFENGKMKYILATAIEVTESVLKNQSIQRQKEIIEQQKEQLEQQNAQLEDQNAQLTSIIENLSEGVVIADNTGEFSMINAEAKRLIYESDQVFALGEAFKNIKLLDMQRKEIPFESLPGFRALRGESVKNDKLILVHPNKEYIIECSAIPIYNMHGDLTKVVCCFHDITETTQQSRKIEEQKKELEAIIENISDGISIFDSKGQYTLANKSAREMFLYSGEYIDKIGDTYKKCEFYNIDGEKIDLENSPSCRVLRGEKFKNLRTTVKFSDKTLEIDMSGTPIYDSEGNFILGVICSRDMTCYFNNEKAIINQYKFLNRIINTFNLPVIRISCPDLNILDINKKAFSIIKLGQPEVQSIKQIKNINVKDLFETIHMEEYCECINDVLKEKKTKYLNKKNHFINGEDIYWNVIFEPMLEANGEIQEILIVIIDVTAEIKSNLIMEKTLRAQGEFLANISHEFKTPLNVISSAAQLFSMYCKSGSLDEKKGSIIKYIESIKQNTYRLSKLINNIVDSSKIESGFFELNLSNNNIVEVVEEVVISVTNFIDRKGLSIIFDTNTEEKIIACDPEKIERIVLNLISNAIKFSDVGDEILVEVKVHNEFVEISVKDNGMGIEDKDLDIIFDRFKQVDKSLTRNAEGTGIGLNLVKSIVELQGGHVCVESKFGQGSKFTIVLPTEKVMQENMMFDSNMRNINESIQVEFSDVS